MSDGYRNSRVHRFSSQGALLDSWGKPGKEEPGEFHLPHSLWVDRQSQVYVCDRENSRIQVFTAAGKFLSQWRDIHKPTDIYFDAQEIAYVSEQRPSISVMEKSGKVLARFETAAPATASGSTPGATSIWLRSGAKKLIKYAEGNDMGGSGRPPRLRARR